MIRETSRSCSRPTRWGATGVVQSYRIPPSAWTQTAKPSPSRSARFLSTPGTLVTDAALSPSGDVVAVRTYLAIFLFRLTPDRTLRALGLRCDTAGLQLQGEGIS
jgi:hypothetical protein